MFFFQKVFFDPYKSTRLNRKRVVIPRKNVSLWLEFVFTWRLMEYTNDHSTDALIILTF